MTHTNCLGLNHASLDLVLMAQIMANITDTTKAQHARSVSDRTGITTIYYHHGIKVVTIVQKLCTFVFTILYSDLPQDIPFFHGVRRYCFDDVRCHFLQNGLEDLFIAIESSFYYMDLPLRS